MVLGTALKNSWKMGSYLHLQFKKLQILLLHCIFYYYSHKQYLVAVLCLYSFFNFSKGKVNKGTVYLSNNYYF